MERGGVEGGGGCTGVVCTGGVTAVRCFFDSRKSIFAGGGVEFGVGVRDRGRFVRWAGEGVNCGKLDDASAGGVILSREDAGIRGDWSERCNGNIGGGFVLALGEYWTLSTPGGVEVSRCVGKDGGM